MWAVCCVLTFGEAAERVGNREQNDEATSSTPVCHAPNKRTKDHTTTEPRHK